MKNDSLRRMLNGNLTRAFNGWHGYVEQVFKIGGI